MTWRVCVCDSVTDSDGVVHTNMLVRKKSNCILLIVLRSIHKRLNAMALPCCLSLVLDVFLAPKNENWIYIYLIHIENWMQRETVFEWTHNLMSSLSSYTPKLFHDSRGNVLECVGTSCRIDVTIQMRAVARQLGQGILQSMWTRNARASAKYHSIVNKFNFV